VVATDAAEHDREGVVERARGWDAPDRRLPRMAVRVDKARHHDHPGRVDDFRVGDVEAPADLDDLAVVDEDVAVRDVAHLRVHRDDEAIADQKPLRAHTYLLGSTAADPCSRRRMYSEHKRDAAGESTSRRRVRVVEPLQICSSMVRPPRSTCATRGRRRLATVDTLGSTCKQ